LLVGVPPADRPRARGSAVYFQVADIHAVFDELTRRGVAFNGQPHVVHRTPQYDLWLTEFNDPDGNALALMSQAAKAAGE
jgi:predicted enzyme related to lactoylglutathione lyase